MGLMCTIILSKYCRRHLIWFPFLFLFCFCFDEKLYRSLKSLYFSIETHFVVTEYAYLIPVKCVVFAYMAYVKYQSMFIISADI